MGLLVDGVCEVLDIAAENLEAAPDFGGGASSRFLLGMAKCDDDVKILLEIDQILDHSQALALPRADPEPSTRDQNQ